MMYTSKQDRMHFRYDVSLLSIMFIYCFYLNTLIIGIIHIPIDNEFVVDSNDTIIGNILSIPRLVLDGFNHHIDI